MDGRKPGHHRRAGVGDDEALRAAHAVADMADWRGDADARVAVTASDGREVGFVGTDDPDAYPIERPETKAATYKPPRSG